jgi:hypothetical protein
LAALERGKPNLPFRVNHISAIVAAFEEKTGTLAWRLIRKARTQSSHLPAPAFAIRVSAFKRSGAGAQGQCANCNNPVAVQASMPQCKMEMDTFPQQTVLQS